MHNKSGVLQDMHNTSGTLVSETIIEKKESFTHTHTYYIYIYSRGNGAS